MMMQGTRKPSPRKSSCSGAALSYQPPQSSHTTTIAVEFQFGPVPIALTTDATQDGPVSLCWLAWSESGASGTTQETAGRLLLAASRITCDGGDTTFCQSGP